MSPRRLRKALTLLKLLISSLFGWLVLVPLSLIIPKACLVVFIEQTPTRFFDNVKYLYLHSCRQPHADTHCVYLTRNAELRGELERRGFPVASENSLRGKWLMLRARVIVEDGLGLTLNLKSFYCYGAKKVQLWHGTPLKRIQLQTYAKRGFLKGTLTRLFRVFIGQHPFYHVLVSSSETCTRIGYAGAFRCGRIVELGYPRNDLFFHVHDDAFLLGADDESYRRIQYLKEQGYKIAIYMPTFRDSRVDALTEGVLELSRLAEFGAQNKIAFVLKSHFNTTDAKLCTADNLVVYDNSKDVYPILPLADLLLTDYSSVFFDFLLLDRPMVFFPYDYEQYVQADRGLLVDYDSVIPGPKTQTQPQLERTIQQILCDGLDMYAARRKASCSVYWKYRDGDTCERVTRFIHHELLHGR